MALSVKIHDLAEGCCEDDAKSAQRRARAARPEFDGVKLVNPFSLEPLPPYEKEVSQAIRNLLRTELEIPLKILNCMQLRAI
jgi:hypothetical protein